MICRTLWRTWRNAAGSFKNPMLPKKEKNENPNRVNKMTRTENILLLQFCPQRMHHSVQKINHPTEKTRVGLIESNMVQLVAFSLYQPKENPSSGIGHFSYFFPQNIRWSLYIIMRWCPSFPNKIIPTTIYYSSFS